MDLNLKHGTGHIDDEDEWVLVGWWWWSQISNRRKGAGLGAPPRVYILGRPTTVAAAARSGLAEIASVFPMHRLILGMQRYADDRRDVDHINGDGLDNRRANLRIPMKTEATPGSSRAQNLANSGSREGTSAFKGVSFDRQTRRWIAQITTGGRNRKIGRYDTQEEAAVAYNLAAHEAWGEYARLNEVPDGVVPVHKPRATSQYRGVSLDRTRQRWTAQLMIAGKQILVGRFASEMEAALAYNAFATERLGDRARLNVIPD